MMSAHRIRIMNGDKQVVATAQVADEGKHWGGTIDLSSAPSAMGEVFCEFEDIVEGNALSLVDDVQAKIRALSLFAMFEDGREAAMNNLQIFPSTGEFSFEPRFARRHANGTVGNKAGTAEPTFGR